MDYRHNINGLLKHLLLFCLSGLLAIECVAERPSVGLVLAGGGARGAAHIGVLKYLEANNIPVDIVTGTSMGAIVGGLYAAGYRADEIESLMLDMDWEAALIDDVPRQKRSLQRRIREDRFSIAGSPGYDDGELKIPSGAIQGQNVILALQRLTQPVAHIEDFDALPRRFRAVATDIVTGEMVVLERGDLALALRASMGVPAIFAPIELDGRLLVDGGITNNLPIDLAKEMGADIVIAVDITSPMLTREALGNLLTITDQLTRLLVVNNTQAQQAMLSPQDVLIVPELDAVSAVSFDAAANAIEAGYRAIEGKADALASLKLASLPLVELPYEVQQGRLIDDVRLKNNSSLSDAVLLAQINTTTGEAFSQEQLERDVNRIHGLGHFELVSYQISKNNDQSIVEIAAEQKSWGTNFLHFGFNLESEFKHDSRFSFLLGYSRQAISDLGGEWLTTLHLGDEPAFQTEIYWPLLTDGKVFGFASAGVFDQALYDYEDGVRTTVYALRQATAMVGLGYEYTTKWQSRLGIRRSSGQAVAVSGLMRREEPDFSEFSLEWSFGFDTRDDIDFPSHGSIVEASWSHFFDRAGGQTEFDQWRIHAGRYFERGRHNLGVNLHLGSTSGDPSIASEFRVGGYGLITGLSAQALRGGAMGVLSAVYYQRYDALPILDGLIGLTLDYGGAWESRASVQADTAVGSVGAFIGADTPLGTLQLGFAIAEEGKQNYYARIGRVF